MTQSHDAGGKDPALSWVDSLLIVRCQTGRKLSNQSLMSTSSSLVTVCTDGRDRIIDSADKGWPKVAESVRNGTIRLL